MYNQIFIQNSQFHFDQEFMNMGEFALPRRSITLFPISNSPYAPPKIAARR